MTLPAQDPVERDYGAFGVYRVRLLTLHSKHVALDIREWLEHGEQRGFTRRGIRIHGMGNVRALKDMLERILKENRDGAR